MPDGVVLLAGSASAFVEIDRTMSYARLLAKLERYDSYRNAPASGRGDAARAPRSHWQETYAGPSRERPFPPVLFVFAPAPRRVAPATRETVFHERARQVGNVGYRLSVATTTLPLLTRNGAGKAVWRVVGNGRGEERRTLAALPKARRARRAWSGLHPRAGPAAVRPPVGRGWEAGRMNDGDEQSPARPGVRPRPRRPRPGSAAAPGVRRLGRRAAGCTTDRHHGLAAGRDRDGVALSTELGGGPRRPGATPIRDALWEPPTRNRRLLG